MTTKQMLMKLTRLMKEARPTMADYLDGKLLDLKHRKRYRNISIDLDSHSHREFEEDDIVIQLYIGGADYLNNNFMKDYKLSEIDDLKTTIKNFTERFNDEQKER